MVLEFGNALRVFSPDNPAVAFIHPGVESGARPSGLNLTGISYVSVKNIAVSGANAVPSGEGAGIWAITINPEGPTPGNLAIESVTVMNGAGDGIHLENADHCTVNSTLVHDNDGAGIELYRSIGKFPITSANIMNNQIHHNNFNGMASAAPNISGDFALSPTSLAVGRGADLERTKWPSSPPLPGRRR